jgi:hypothetical protein
MKSEIASEIMTILARINFEMEDLAKAIEKIGDKREKAKFRMAYAMLVGHQYTELVLPIIQQHPGLKPAIEDEDEDR